MPAPHGLFQVWSPDTVAECLNGVDDKLYSALWATIPVSKKPKSEYNDDFSTYATARVWKKLTIAQQAKLNKLAIAHEKENRYEA